MTVNPVHSGQSEMKQVHESAHNDNVSYLNKKVSVVLIMFNILWLDMYCYVIRI